MVRCGRGEMFYGPMISARLLVSLKDESLDDITDVMDMNLGKVWEMVRHREAWRAVSPRGQEEATE